MAKMQGVFAGAAACWPLRSLAELVSVLRFAPNHTFPRKTHRGVEGVKPENGCGRGGGFGSRQARALGSPGRSRRRTGSSRSGMSSGRSRNGRRSTVRGLSALDKEYEEGPKKQNRPAEGANLTPPDCTAG